MPLRDILRRRGFDLKLTPKPTAPSVPCEESSGLPAIDQSRTGKLPLIAYRTKDASFNFKIEVASANREWMKETIGGFGNRCLPLRIANQSGWFIGNPETIEVVWDGSCGVNGLVLTKGPLDGQFVASHFGHGILTWKIPFLFRTPPGYNLYIRGPANWCKDGACPLDGIVEADWSVATFTMNWKITRAHLPVRFEKAEPICMVFPIARGEMRRFQPEIRPLTDDCELEERYNEWRLSREQFNKQKSSSNSPTDWQRHYYLGKTNRGETFPAHEVTLKLKRFRESD